mmetsp:Transcript_16929/g.25105  ORF Transcript_16929/g.25105 Transcript_16929/m.25105 type:complete len:262 (+) Transcript_16929:2791-3576(+)
MSYGKESRNLPTKIRNQGLDRLAGKSLHPDVRKTVSGEMKTPRTRRNRSHQVVRARRRRPGDESGRRQARKTRKFQMLMPMKRMMSPRKLQPHHERNVQQEAALERRRLSPNSTNLIRNHQLDQSGRLDRTNRRKTEEKVRTPVLRSEREVDNQSLRVVIQRRSPRKTKVKTTLLRRKGKVDLESLRLRIPRQKVLRRLREDPRELKQRKKKLSQANRKRKAVKRTRRKRKRKNRLLHAGPQGRDAPPPPREMSTMTVQRA